MKKSFKDITVLIDIDDVMNDLLPAWCEYLNRHNDLNVKPDDITDWDITKFFPTLKPEKIFRPLSSEYFWSTVKPKDGAVEHVKKLLDDGFNVYLCTTTSYINIAPKFEHVIKRYFPYIPWKKVVVTSNKQMIKADFLVDDGIHNLEGGNYTKILVSMPHNKSYDAEANGMIRCDNWKSIYDTVVNLSKQIIEGDTNVD